MLSAPRLGPVLQPVWWLKIVYWYSQRRFGRVPSALQVIYARMPRLLLPQAWMLRLGERIGGEASLGQLVAIAVSARNECEFCTDLHFATALSRKIPQDKLLAVLKLGELARDGGLMGAQECPSGLSVREWRALRYALSVVERKVSDEDFQALRPFYNESELVELTWYAAFVSYLNTLARGVALGADGFCELPLFEARARK